MEKTLKAKNILLLVLWLFVTVHLLKDFTQDILMIPTVLDKLGNVQENLNWLPKSFNTFYIYFLGTLSVIAELVIVVSVPFMLVKTASHSVIKLVKASGIFLLAFFTIALLLDPKFNVPVVDSINDLTDNFWQNLLWAILGGFIGAIIALWLDTFRLPQIRISCPDTIHDDNPYTDNPPRPFKRAKFFRVKVENKELSRWAKLFFNRVSAEQLSAKIYIKEIDKTMKGRWASTLELAFTNFENAIRLAQFPETETLSPGEYVPLDVFIKPDGIDEAYGWNNEAYLYQWRTPHYKMNPGAYSITVTVSMSNGQTKTATFEAIVDKTIENSSIKQISLVN
jgi:hypothetical protein